MDHPTQITPVLSVITPVRNARDFIAACLANVAEQSLPSTEHIVMDAMSDDGTSEIVAAAAKHDSRIRHVRAPDRGQSDALNNAIAHARAPVIAILNVDDFYAPAVLPRIARTFKELPVPSMVIGNCNVLDADDRIVEVNAPTCFDTAKLIGGYDLFPFPLNPSAYFYHKAIHDQIGGYDESDHFNMDVRFLLRAFEVANVVKIDEALGNFRLRPGAKTFEAVRSGAARRQLHAAYRAALYTLRPRRKLDAAFWFCRTRAWQLNRTLREVARIRRSKSRKSKSPRGIRT